MVAGGFVLAGTAVALLEISSSSEVLSYAFLFAGPAVGGFFAGRASPGSTMVEPGMGALLLFASLFALLATVPGIQELMSEASNAGIARAGLAGLVVGAGGFVGGLLGERTSKEPSHSGIRWLGLSALIALGAMFVVSMALFMLVQFDAMQAESTGDDSAAAFGMAIVGLSAFLGGLVTQAAAPRRLLLASGGGMSLVLVGLVPFALTASKVHGSDAVLGLLVLAVPCIGIGALGALLSWTFKRRRLQQQDLSAAFD